MKAMNKIPLSDVLEHISNELWKANERALNSGRATMQFSECEIEFAIETEGKGETGIKLYFVNIGGELKRSETNTMKIKFNPIPGQPIINENLVPGAAPKPRRQSQKRAGKSQ
jgi:hypothetical protein